jgi:hypothetical protein
MNRKKGRNVKAQEQFYSAPQSCSQQGNEKEVIRKFQSHVISGIITPSGIDHPTIFLYFSADCSFCDTE